MTTKKSKKPRKVRAVSIHFAEKQKRAFIEKRILRWYRECRDLLQARNIPNADDLAMDLFTQHCRPAGMKKWPEPADVVRDLPATT